MLAALVLLSTACSSTSSTSPVTILHFSDYHSHAVPFYADGEHHSAGIARAIAYLEPLAARDDVLVFDGGDTMNLGAPVWSDHYRCVEWSWWNGIVDAMAYGNHDADYGAAVFADCRQQVDFPILGANVAGPDGGPLFVPEGKPYVIFERHGHRIGVFALAGDDFRTLIRETTAPVAGVQFLDRVETARKVVDELRHERDVDAVVLIGHASTEDDEELARQVDGIDLILGTHSHRLEPLRTINGTGTRMISPGQYLTHISRVDLLFADGPDGMLDSIRGELVRMTPDMPEAPEIAARVADLQRKMESDPEIAPLFEVIGHLEQELSNDEVNLRTNDLGGFVMDLVRNATDADLSLSTSSSFRGSLPPGPIRETDLRNVLPYDNRVVRVELDGRELMLLLERVDSLRGTDSYAQISGHPGAVDPDSRYLIATTDYLAGIAAGYRDIFESLTVQPTEIRVRDLVRRAIAEPGRNSDGTD